MTNAQQRVEMRELNDEHRSTKKLAYCSFFKAFKVFGVFLVILLLLVNLGVTVLMWGTSLVEEQIIQSMVIKNNTRSYDWWVKSPIKPYMQVRIFNYTNVERFLAGGDDKLNVIEVGPYVYRETLERVNVVFHENGTVSYQEKRSFEYCPEKSHGSLDDQLTVPNMVFLGSAAAANGMSYLKRWTLSALHVSLNAGPFLTRPVRDLFWGYDDPLFMMGKSLMAFQETQGKKDEQEHKKIGLLIARNGTSSERVSIHTGAQDISRLGVIDRYAGLAKMVHWGTDECNRIDGTDGSMFPPNMVSETATLHMYLKDMCRKFPLVFKEYVTATGSGVRAMRFHPPRDVFETTRPENACFCHSTSASECPPAGVFNASPCAYNAPLMLSFPHFYLGEPSLLDHVSGLAPDAAKHDMFLDIHPKFGFPVAGESRFQLNMMVRKSFGIALLDKFEDEAILPIAWFEVVVDEIPPEVEQVLQELHFATHTFKWLTLWCFLGLLLILTLLLGFFISARVRQTWFGSMPKV